VAFTSDGARVLISAYTADSAPHVLDLTSGSVVAVLEGHTDAVFGVAISPDDSTAVTASDDGTLRIWDTRTWRSLAPPLIVAEERSPDRRVLAIAFSPDGNHVAIGLGAGSLELWSIEARSRLLSVKGHRGAVSSIAYSPDGTRIASGSWRDHLVKVWDAKSGELLLTLEGHFDRVFCIDFSPDGKYILTTGADNMARFWDAHTGEQLHTMDRAEYTGHFSPDGSSVLLTGPEGYTRITRIERRSPPEIRAILERKLPWRYIDGRLVRQPVRPSSSPPN
jgi:WD40 repeat protein